MSHPLTGIFLDSSDPKAIGRYRGLGVIRGVTTNPTILLKEGVASGWEGLEDRVKEIAALIDPYPLSVEVTTNDTTGMLEQALLFSSWAKNVNVKIPVHGPQGEGDNLKLVSDLERRHNVRVNVTAMMSAQQCLLAAFAGATYVSLFAGRVNNMGYNACQEIRRLRGLIDQFNLPSKIIAGSTREALNILEWFEAGADIVTALPVLLETMLVHPYSKETVQQFLRDGARLERSASTLRVG